jgi:hypothetical protein
VLPLNEVLFGRDFQRTFAIACWLAAIFDGACSQKLSASNWGSAGRFYAWPLTGNTQALEMASIATVTRGIENPRHVFLTHVFKFSFHEDITSLGWSPFR